MPEILILREITMLVFFNRLDGTTVAINVNHIVTVELHKDEHERTNGTTLILSNGTRESVKEPMEDAIHSINSAQSPHNSPATHQF
jgi:uncharacterized protein YlzI (FlbEa/FlbD family)